MFIASNSLASRKKNKNNFCNCKSLTPANLIPWQLSQICCTCRAQSALREGQHGRFNAPWTTTQAASGTNGLVLGIEGLALSRISIHIEWPSKKGPVWRRTDHTCSVKNKLSHRTFSKWANPKLSETPQSKAARIPPKQYHNYNYKNRHGNSYIDENWLGFPLSLLQTLNNLHCGSTATTRIHMLPLKKSADESTDAGQLRRFLTKGTSRSGNFGGQKIHEWKNPKYFNQWFDWIFENLLWISTFHCLIKWCHKCFSWHVFDYMFCSHHVFMLCFSAM